MSNKLISFRSPTSGSANTQYHRFHQVSPIFRSKLAFKVPTSLLDRDEFGFIRLLWLKANLWKFEREIIALLATSFSSLPSSLLTRHHW